MSAALAAEPAAAPVAELPAIAVTQPRTGAVSRSGTRTATPLREVPQTVDIVDPAQAEVYGVRTLGQVLEGLPNVSDAQDTRFDALRIRGFSSGSDFFLDGLRDDSQYVRDLRNVERVEVLKGPAAALYGRGAPGGIVNRISKVPEPGRASHLAVQTGSHDLRSGYLDASFDAGQDISLRLNTGAEAWNSFRHRLRGERQLLAPALAWRVSPAVDWLLQYEFSRFDRVPDRGIPSVDGRPAAVPRTTVYGDPARDEIDDRVRTLRSRLGWRLPDGWELRHTLSWFRLRSDFGNTYPTGQRAGQVLRQRWGQQLRTQNLYNTLELEGRLSAGGLGHTVLLGLEWGAQQRQPRLLRAVGDVPSVDLYDPDLSRQHQAGLALRSDNHHRVRSGGLYLQDQLALGERWRLLLGGRLDQFRVRTDDRLRQRSEARASRRFSPRFGLVWTPLPGQAFYLSYGKSFAPAGGGLIGITPGAAENALAPEFSRQYEAGFKSDGFDGRLSTTLAVYQLELYNRRTRDADDPTRIVLRGLQRSRGLEFTLAGRLSERWQVRGGVGLQQASIVRDSAGLQGRRVSNVARHNGSLFVAYAAPGGWFAETGLTLVGARYADSANRVTLPGYVRWDASFGYRHARWEARLALRNLGDAHYFRSASSAGQIQPGEPRSLVASATLHF
ncbi:TonB-dependent receptor [Bordetella genomosp. 12]|uniref:TonB-dependent siderophore receptor n=1 Tax=Bordetella genomosp. 12 TaxID=463035 RepID=A0A261VV33_9BORD|nr:TonB-dependent siderophore receptor [Bordetella genomosp. 12]OZI77362.1 TonB-dependent siderophore receptor [Bordetella genomosp. 12]